MILDTEIEQQSQQLPREYQDYLDRLEKDYLSACAAFTVIRNFLLTFTANSANISLCLVAIDFGLGAMSAGLLGFTLGSIPATMDIGEAGIDLTSDYKVADISKVVVGGSKLIAAAGVSWNATNEHRRLMGYAKESVKAFEVEVFHYEVKVQPTDGLTLSFEIQVILAASFGIALLPWLLGMFRRY